MPKKPEPKKGASAGKPGAMPQGPSVFTVLKPYRAMIAVLAGLTLAANAITLWMPKIISHAIDDYVHGDLVLADVGWKLGWLAAAIFALTALQNLVQVIASERVAKDLRGRLVDKLSRQTYVYVQKANPATLLTNLTSDMDSVKLFVSMAVASIISSIFLIIGAAFLLLITDWKLALAVLVIVPVIGYVFTSSLQRVRQLFFKSREVIDRLNRVINESILGSALVRVLNSQAPEYDKFTEANAASRDISLSIVRIFAGLIPTITFIASLASLVILALGGHFVIGGDMSLGDFTAFTTYAAILIFPIIMLGFMGNVIAQATASYGRIAAVTEAPDPAPAGTLDAELDGGIEARGLTVAYGEKKALKDVSFKVEPGSRTAIIGPTAAGKSQLLSVITGLLQPNEGEVRFDGRPLAEYDPKALHRQVGFVFQDSITFNMSLRENIAFSEGVTEADLEKAIRTAELADLVKSLPDGLDTVVSERGTSLSGGQKQRLMLARALALNPRILLLDDFTARVDTVTEGKILANLRANYPGLTLISVTQKVASVEEYDKILLLMEGELLAEGTHKELLSKSPEYVQIYESQKSTNAYEVHAD